MKGGLVIILSAFIFFWMQTRCSVPNTPTKQAKNLLQYSTMLSLDTGLNFTVCRFNLSSQTWILCKDSVQGRKLYPEAHILQWPLTRIIALSSVYAAWICEVGHCEALIGIDNVQYSTQAQIKQGYVQGDIVSYPGSLHSQLEALIMARPQLILTSSYEPISERVYAILAQHGIAVWQCADYLESHPLGRSSWLAAAAALFGTPKITLDSLKASQKQYLSLSDSAQKLVPKPRVLSSGMNANGQWLVPGGKSFAAQLIKDAGGDYLWKTDAHSGSLEFTTEYVCAEAQRADVWINPLELECLNELQRYPNPVQKIAAVGKGAVYIPNKKRNADGYSAYWDEALLHPERVLRDLTTLFHAPSRLNSCNYYISLKRQCP